MKRFAFLIPAFLLFASYASAYTNPILPYDYSDPDVCKVGQDYYMTASSFHCIPGLQILHSSDLIHWQLVDAALPACVPGTEGTLSTQLGGGVWAPAIRFHDNRFHIYYGDPDRGIYCIRSQMLDTPKLPAYWEKPVLVCAARGFIDPCPVWDKDGRCFLVHAMAGSRAGLKSVLALMELTPDGLQVITPSHIIYDGHTDNPTCEGPKLYFRNGWYYIFSPAGGVSTGWQLCLRSRNIEGPYECRRVLEQGSTSVNGPHQGAWIDDWFVHFQDVGVAGRIVHLQPLRWQDDWPVIGSNGFPVKSYDLSGTGSIETPQIGFHDSFDVAKPKLEWQWNGNYDPRYCFADATSGILRLYTFPAEDLLHAPNLLLQKIPWCESFTVTAKVRFCPNPKSDVKEQAGLIVYGKEYFCLPAPANSSWVWLRAVVTNYNDWQFYISTDGSTYVPYGQIFHAKEGCWVGAKIGFYSTRQPSAVNDAGWLDIDSFDLRR